MGCPYFNVSERDRVNRWLYLFSSCGGAKIPLDIFLMQIPYEQQITGWNSKQFSEKCLFKMSC